jgi:hypothetical protein
LKIRPRFAIFWEDKTSRRVDAAGRVIVDYIFDFTDVRQVFTQPVIAGVMKEEIISARIEVIR